MSDEKYVLALDAGSTGVKATLYNREAKEVAKSYYKLTVDFTPDGRVETDPDQIFTAARDTIRSVLSKANTTARNVVSLGITNQRSTFTSWDKKTGKTLHPFIGWSDLRSAEVCDAANNALKTRIIRAACGLLYLVTRSPRFLTMQKFTFKTTTTGPKLCWVWKNIPELKEVHKRGDLCVGTLDSYLLYRLTGGKVHAMDYSNASATGIFDPYELTWSLVMKMLCYPYELPPWSVLPEVKPTAYDYGATTPDLFGAPIPINVLIGDQQAALFGQCCFEIGEAKATLGTGCFMVVNTGARPLASFGGLYPLIAWKIGDKVTYCMEGSESAAGISFDWLKTAGLIETVGDIEALASKVSSSDGVYFVPALYGIGPPYWDSKARGMFIGMTAFSSRSHLIRAAVDSMGFRIGELVATARTDLPEIPPMRTLKVDGGVTQNNLICQVMADLSNVKVDRPNNIDATGLGAALLAGLHSGFWKSLDEIRDLRTTNKAFEPQISKVERERRAGQWKSAVMRTMGWNGSTQFTPRRHIWRFVIFGALFGLLQYYMVPIILAFLGKKIVPI